MQNVIRLQSAILLLSAWIAKNKDWIAKYNHCKNCKCCPVSLFIVRSQRSSWIQVFNCGEICNVSTWQIGAGDKYQVCTSSAHLGAMQVTGVPASVTWLFKTCSGTICQFAVNLRLAKCLESNQCYASQCLPLNTAVQCTWAVSSDLPRGLCFDWPLSPS